MISHLLSKFHKVSHGILYFHNRPTDGEKTLSDEISRLLSIVLSLGDLSLGFSAL